MNPEHQDQGGPAGDTPQPVTGPALLNELRRLRDLARRFSIDALEEHEDEYHQAFAHLDAGLTALLAELPATAPAQEPGS